MSGTLQNQQKLIIINKSEKVINVFNKTRKVEEKEWVNKKKRYID